MSEDRAALNTLVRLRNFEVTEAITTTYQHITNEFLESKKSEKLDFQINELLFIAKHEQRRVLQPLIYSDPFLKQTMDTNHKFSRLTSGWISPKFKVVYSASPSTNDPELEAVFDAPNNLLDQLTGTSKSLPNEQDRMGFVEQIAKKFNALMLGRRPYLEGELRKIAAWSQS